MATRQRIVSGARLQAQSRKMLKTHADELLKVWVVMALLIANTSVTMHFTGQLFE